MHMALRDFSGGPIVVQGVDMRREIEAEREKVFAFARAVRDGSLTGAGGLPFTNIVNIGIGGSDLGPAMAARALSPWRGQGPRTHFVANVDGADLADTLAPLDLSRTLFIVSSKTFTTQETMTNAASARGRIARHAWRNSRVQTFRSRIDAVRTKWLNSASNHRAYLASGTGWAADIRFGRRSVWRSPSASGPSISRNFCAAVSILTRISRRRRFLAIFPRLWDSSASGTAMCLAARRMRSFPTTSVSRVFPPICNNSTWKMNGKSVTRDGALVATATGPVIFGEPGTNGQHAFFQLLHQGTDVTPIDFLIAAEPVEADAHHHALLFANCLAQSEAFMHGRTLDEAKALLRKEGRSEADIERLAPIKFSRARPPVRRAPLSRAARPAHAGTAGGARRTQGIRAVGDLGHQSLRPMGRRTWQGAGESSAPIVGARRMLPPRVGRLYGRPDRVEAKHLTAMRRVNLPISLNQVEAGSPGIFQVSVRVLAPARRNTRMSAVWPAFTEMSNIARNPSICELAAKLCEAPGHWWRRRRLRPDWDRQRNKPCRRPRNPRESAWNSPPLSQKTPTPVVASERVHHAPVGR